MTNNNEFFSQFAKAVKVETISPEGPSRKLSFRKSMVLPALIITALVAFGIVVVGLSVYSFLALAVILPGVVVIDSILDSRKGKSSSQA